MKKKPYLCAKQTTNIAMKSKSLPILFLCCVVPVLTFGQTKPLPKWATTNPISTATVKKAVASGATLDEARHNAVNILVSQTGVAAIIGYAAPLLAGGMMARVWSYRKKVRRMHGGNMGPGPLL